MGWVGKYQTATTEEERFAALDSLLGRIRPQLFVFLYRYGKPADMEDLIQLVLIKIATDIEDFHGESQVSFMAWCRTIAHRTASSRYRLKSVQLTEAMPPDVVKRLLEKSWSATESVPEHFDDFQEALKVLDELGEPCCSLLKRRYLFDMECEGIANLTGEKADTIRVRVVRCRDRAQHLFKTRCLERAQHPFER